MEMKDRLISDLSLAAFLKARGYPIKRIERDGERVNWLFGAVPESALLEYFNGSDLTSARVLFSAFRELRAMSRQRF